MMLGQHCGNKQQCPCAKNVTARLVHELTELKPTPKTRHDCGSSGGWWVGETKIPSNVDLKRWVVLLIPLGSELVKRTMTDSRQKRWMIKNMKSHFEDSKCESF